MAENTRSSRRIVKAAIKPDFQYDEESVGFLVRSAEESQHQSSELDSNSNWESATDSGKNKKVFSTVERHRIYL